MRILITPASLCSHPEVLQGLWDSHKLSFSCQALPVDLHHYDCIILGNEPFTSAEIARACKLRLIIRYGVTVHNVDLHAAKLAGIQVAHCPTFADSGKGISLSVVEYIFSAIFYFAKRLHFINGKSAQALQTFLFDDIAGKTLGIIGMGAIGRTLAVKAALLGMKVRAYNRSDCTQLCAELGVPSSSYSSCEDVLSQSDYISVNVALNDQTYHFINSFRLSLMKPSACFINTAQAEVVDPAALYEALSTGRIAGAALDFVYPGYDFSALPNVIVTPHIASRTVGDMYRKAELVKFILRTYLSEGAVPSDFLAPLPISALL